jgi:TP901 family phage tail tape measure protein
MPAISQTLGFNATGAINALTRLKSALDAVNGSLVAFSNSAKQFQGGLFTTALQKLNTQSKTTAQSVTQVGTAAQKTGQHLHQAGQAGAAAGHNIQLSWENVSRIIAGQLIFRALTTLISAFTDAIGRARELGLAVAEIATIDSDALGPQKAITTEILAMSDALGITAETIAEGVYQTLSNQVVEAGDALKFTAEAAQLAQVTMSSTGAAVDALSSVMNVFGKEAGTAREISAQLFELVNLGRFRLEEIANQLGKVTGLAKIAGISFQEVGASLATMTQSGLDVRVAVTQLQSVITAILNPTDEMMELFRRWNVRDGVEAIKKFGGLTGVLAKMSQETGGNAAQMRDLFKRVRALAGSLGILNKEGKVQTGILERLKVATDAYNKAIEEFNEAPAQRLTIEMNKLRNEFTRLGIEAGPILTLIIKGINDLVVSTDHWIDIFSIGIHSLITGFKELAAAPGAFLSADFSAIDRLEAENDAFTDRVIAKWDRSEKVKRTLSAETGDVFAATLNGMEGNNAVAVENIAKKWKEGLSKVEVAWDLLNENFTATLASLEKGFENATAPLKDFVSGVDNVIKQSEQRVLDFEQKLKDIKFGEALAGKDAFQQQQFLGQEAAKALAEAKSNLLRNDLDETKRNEALKRADQAITLAEQRVAASEKTKFAGDDVQASNQLKRLLNERIELEKNLQRSLKTEKEQVIILENKVLAITKERETIEKRIGELRKEFAKAPEFDKGPILAAIEEAKARIGELKFFPETGGEANILNKLGITPEALTLAQTKIQEAINNVNFSLEEKLIGQLDTALKGKEYNVQITIPAGIEAQLSQVVTQTDTLAEAVVRSGSTPVIDSNSLITGGQQIVNATTSTNTLTQAFNNTAQTVNRVSEAVAQLNIGTQRTVDTANLLKSAWDRVAAAARAAAVASAAAAAAAGGAAYHGGFPQYLANGGVRGQDVINAQLAKGEFVVNSRSSAKFFSELNAMNAGSQPVFREQGGAVTNVGEINVTVKGGDSSQQTLREIGNGLRREILRGNIRLN